MKSLTIRFAALGAVAFVFACVAHEAIGHAGTCLLTGGNVELLTSVFFHCRPGLPWVDAAGPLLNLASAVIALMALRVWTGSATARAFIALVLAFNVMWGAGYLPYTAVAGVGDWAFVIEKHGPLPPWILRVVMAFAGLWLYSRTMKIVAPHLPTGRPLIAAYLAGAVVALASVSLYSGPLLPAVREALLEGALAPIGVLYLAIVRRTNAPDTSTLLVETPGRGFWILALGIVIAFLALMGPGYAAV